MASLIKRGKVWYVKYYFGGKEHRKAVSHDKRTALEYKSHLETQLSRGKLNLPIRKYSWEAFTQEYLNYSKTNKSAGAVQFDRQALRSLNRILQPQTTEDITPAALERWKSIRVAEVTPTCVNIELRQIKAALRKGIQWGYANEKQIAGVNQLKVPKKAPRFLSREEIIKLKRASEPRWWDMFYFLIMTGLRLGEFVHLRWDWIDFEKKTLTVKADDHWIPKDYESREIPLHPELMKILKRLRAGNGDRYIFWNGGHARTFAARIYQKFRKYCKKAGVGPYRVHDLRHTFASHLVINGVDLIVVRDLLGHTSVKTTEIYAHLNPSKHHEAIARLAPF